MHFRFGKTIELVFSDTMSQNYTTNTDIPRDFTIIFYETLVWKALRLLDTKNHTEQLSAIIVWIINNLRRPFSNEIKLHKENIKSREEWFKYLLFLRIFYLRVIKTFNYKFN